MGASRELRILLVGDHHAELEALCREVAEPSAIEIVGHARSAAEAHELLELLSPDLVLLDLEAEAIGSPAAIPQVKTHPGAPIVFVLTSDDSAAARTASFAAGADGFIGKAEAREKLRALIAKIRPYVSRAS
ncbi:MAG TPA: response regulator [Candidatus Polarisedimenticolaceae bacterium]|nr:response regulator [Candidatus Polarisedimenticolaceae bacterium]